MLGKSVEFVGGPMCGERCKAKYADLGEVVFLRRITEVKDPVVHVYTCEKRGKDFVYMGLRPYVREYAGRIMGTIP